MRNPTEVLHNKELELDRVKKEIDALRIAARLLNEGMAGTITEMRLPDHAMDVRHGIEMP